MSHFNYDSVRQLANKQLELNDFLHSLKKRSGFKKGFQNDSRTIQTLSDGREENVYTLVREKLQKILAMKAALGEVSPEVEKILAIGFGPGTRFDQWLDAQKKHREHSTFDNLRQQIISPTAEVTPSSDPMQVYLRKIQAGYGQLQLLQLYLERMQQSSNIDKDDKALLKHYSQDINTLMGQIQSLNFEAAIAAGPDGIARLYQSKKFGGFYQNSVFMAEIFKSIIGPKLKEILEKSKGFSLHFSPEESVDRGFLDDLIQSLHNLPLLPRDFPYEPAQKAMQANSEVIQGQIQIQQRITREQLKRSQLLQELLDLETEVPTPSMYKSFSAPKRSGTIEEILCAYNPERFHRTPHEAFIIKDCLAIYLGRSRDFGGINPQEFIGSELLKLHDKDAVFTILAAISPVGTTNIAPGINYHFSPIDKIRAYANLIKAIKKDKLKIGAGDNLEQIRLLAERMLYLMTKYNIPKNNPDVVMVKELIASSGIVKAGKAVRGFFSKKENESTQTKTIQKLFRSYDEKKPLSLDDLAQRIGGKDKERMRSSPPAVEVTSRPNITVGGASVPTEPSTPASVRTDVVDEELTRSSPPAVEVTSRPSITVGGAGVPTESSIPASVRTNVVTEPESSGAAVAQAPTQAKPKDFLAEIRTRPQLKHVDKPKTSQTSKLEKPSIKTLLQNKMGNMSQYDSDSDSDDDDKTPKSPWV